MRILLALGGNALLCRDEKPDILIQRNRLKSIASYINKIAKNNELIIIHGNGPQIGLIADESEHDEKLTIPYPLDTLGAETQGMIGYWISEIIDIQNKPIVILSRTLVDINDISDKFIGMRYPTEKIAKQISKKYNWKIGLDGDKYRRIVASPKPISVMEVDAINLLVQNNYTVICGGGGGIPINPETLDGMDGVIDKDLTASVLAQSLNVDLFLIVTDVDYIYRDYGTDHAQPIKHIQYNSLLSFNISEVSITPKINAISSYVKSTGNSGVIGSLSIIKDIADGIKINKLNATFVYK